MKNIVLFTFVSVVLAACGTPKGVLKPEKSPAEMRQEAASKPQLCVPPAMWVATKDGKDWVCAQPTPPQPIYGGYPVYPTTFWWCFGCRGSRHW